jgi:hypothetical protein
VRVSKVPSVEDVFESEAAIGLRGMRGGSAGRGCTKGAWSVKDVDGGKYMSGAFEAR